MTRGEGRILPLPLPLPAEGEGQGEGRLRARSPRPSLASASSALTRLGGLLPATSLDHLSPADRIFGWVNQKGAGAHKGQLRIARIDCTTPAAQAIETFPGGLPLAILGKPKQSQAQFYVGEPSGAPLATDPKTTAYFQATGAPQKRLRGRIVYPHHAAAGPANASYWNVAQALDDARQPGAGNIGTPGQPLYREYIKHREQQNDPACARTSQKWSIKAWIKPGTVFTASIDVFNLNGAELGALIWVLNLDDDHYHRVGGGKPLGFGSVRIEVSALKLKKGTARKQDFLSLSRPAAIPAVAGPDCAINWSLDGARLTLPFREAVVTLHGNGNVFVDIRFISAFRRSAKGYDDDVPHHYPRIAPAPQPDGENFRWFKDHSNEVLGALYDESDAPEDEGLNTTNPRA